MTLSSTALIVGGLTPLGASFARYLTANGAPSVVVYDNVRSGQNNEELPKSATVVLGSVNNEQLLAKALNENKVESVFYFPRGLCDPASQETDPVKSAREITVGVTHLLDAVRKAPSVKVIVLASSLEVYGPTLSDQSAGPLEKTTLRPQSAFAAALMGAESMLHAYAMSYRLNIKIARLPTTVFWAATPPANVPAQVADAAVNGTKLSVPDDTTVNLLLAKDAFTAISKLSEHTGGVAEIFNVAGSYDFTVGALRSKFAEALNGGTLAGTHGAGQPTKIDRSKILALGWTDSSGAEFDNALSTELKEHNATAVNGLSPAPAKNRVRFLVYGGKGWIGAQFVKLLEANAIPYVVGASRPGSDPDDNVVDEILSVAPSHVVSMLGRTHGPGIGNIDYLEGGPDKLRENLQDNLYAPWILANICEKFGVHFTYLGTGCIFSYNEEHAQGGKGYKEEDRPTFVGNKYSVVKGFTDLSLRAFENTLNARIRLPVNDEDSPRNLLRKLVSFKTVLDVPNSLTYLPDCLPILLDLALRQEVGNINLVNPGAISFVEILKIYEAETGKKLEYSSQTLEDNPNAAKLRAHCALDTSRVQQLCPQILQSREAMRQAARNLKISAT
ncbi:NAD dependent epimerase/dehydratase [Aphelenchoides avenae]|nr:NAD dependent epimerase/dehydratase [Aphelenchus avenae]